MAIRVKALAPGVYGHYREAGHEFEIHDEKHFSKKWMKKLDESSEVPAGKGKAKSKGNAKAEPELAPSEPVSQSDGDVL